MYLWRRLTPEQREEMLQRRKLASRSWHTPPHPLGGAGEYHLSATCYEHKPHVGLSPERMDRFAADLLAVLASIEVHAWCLLPNHYHLHVTTPELEQTVARIGKLHGRSSFDWNGEEATRGRQVWHGVADRKIRSEAHGWATVNDIHHNPVRHGYVQKWQDWPWSSARDYLDAVGEKEARRVWTQFPC